MTPDEMRAARGLINLSLEDLSRDIDISVARLERFEGGWSLDIDDHRKIMSYFEREGVKFMSDGMGYANSQTFHGVSTFFMSKCSTRSGCRLVIDGSVAGAVWS